MIQYARVFVTATLIDPKHLLSTLDNKYYTWVDKVFETVKTALLFLSRKLALPMQLLALLESIQLVIS
jgi:hypothetical protein